MDQVPEQSNQTPAPKSWAYTAGAAVLFLLLAGGAYAYWYSKPVVQEGLVNTDISGWKTYTDTQYGFEFQYPTSWSATSNDVESADFKIIIRVKNPARAGNRETDEPFEQFIVSSNIQTCEGKPINIGDRIGTDSGWREGFAYDRHICFVTQDWPLVISLNTYDVPSQEMMDKILSTFKFINIPSAVSESSIKIISPTNGVKIPDYADFDVRWEVTPLLPNEIVEIYVSGARPRQFKCRPEYSGDLVSDYECTEALLTEVPASVGTYTLRINPGCRFEMPIHIRIAVKNGNSSDSVGPIILQGGACGPSL